MPPKGRKSLASWQFCEVCNVIVSQKDLAVHSEGSCPPSSDEWKHGYIKEKMLFGIMEDAGEDVFSKIPKHKQDNLVLLSKSALQLCDIAIGDPVVVTLCGITTIMRAWPTVERSLVSVLIHKQAIELHWKSTDNHNVMVKRLATVPLPAEEILFDMEEKSHFTSEFLNVVHTKYRGRILCVGDRLHIQYYGKDMFLTVQHIMPFEGKVHRDDGLQITKDLERLSLQSFAGDKGFYKVEGQTKWTIILSQQSEKKELSQNKLSSIGGLQDVIAEVREIMQLALGNMLITEGMQVIRGVLLFGVSGTGKTMLMEALAAESTASVITVRGAEIYSKYLGETESKLRQLFQKAKDGAPSVLLLDEIDALCPKRDQDGGGSEQDRRVISTLLTLMDELHSKKGSSAAVFVLATTSKPDAIDSSLRRPGRFDREVEVSVPTPSARLDILQKLLASTPHELTDDYLQEVAHAAHGFVGADLASLCSLAANQAIKRACGSVDKVIIQPEDLLGALKQVKPSAMREVLCEITDVRWSDIGGQHDLKLKLQQSVEWPLKHPEAFKRLGISPPRGILMYGPPGCSKTMIAKALATESKLNFISIKGPELFSKWVGESERAVREVFRRARQVAPAIVFFDELDALGGERSSGSRSGSSSAQERVLAQLLTELDGVEPLGNVTVVGATNRPDRIDKALLRPGRLDRIIYVPLPDAQARKEILEMQLMKMPIGTDVEIEELVVKTHGYSGAEVLAVCHEAALGALEENINAAIVCHCHFLKGLAVIKPRTPASLLKLYDEYQKAG